MQIRWLAILACLLFTACSETATEKVAKNENESAKSVVPKPVDSESKVEATAVLPAETKVEAPAEAKVDAPTEAKGEAPADPNAEPKSPAEKFEAVKLKYETARSEFMTAYQKVAEADRSQFVTDKFPKAEDYAEEFFEIAAASPEDDAAFESLMWVATNVRSGEAGKQAFDILFADHLENEGLAAVCMSLGYAAPSQEVEDRLHRMIESSPHDSVKAGATFALARYLKSVENAKKFVKENPDAKRFDEETLPYIDAFEPQSQVIETLYQTLISDYATLKPSERSKRTYKSMAEGSLFEMNNLSIGLTAPDIEGEDFDGTSFKLSDYRGKIVVLDFWGDW